MHNTDPTETNQKNDVWNYEAMMERMLQNTSLAYTIINLFLEDVPVQLDNLKDAIETGDLKQIRLYSHAIKGSASNLGGEAMRVTAESIEEYAIKKELKSIESIYPLLETQYKELEELLINYLENLD